MPRPSSVHMVPTEADHHEKTETGSMDMPRMTSTPPFTKDLRIRLPSVQPARLTKACLHLVETLYYLISLSSPIKTPWTSVLWDIVLEWSFITTGNPISSVAFAASSASTPSLFQQQGCRIPLTVRCGSRREASHCF